MNEREFIINKMVNYLISNRKSKGGKPTQFQRHILRNREINVSYHDIAEIILDFTLQGLKYNQDVKLTKVASWTGTRLLTYVNHDISELTPAEFEDLRINIGVNALGILVTLGYIKKRVDQINDRREVYIDYVDMVINPLEPLVADCLERPDVDPSEFWTKPVDTNGISIVKRMPSKLGSYYSPNALPELYKALNALQGTVYAKETRVERVAREALTTGGHWSVPDEYDIRSKEVKAARIALKKGDRNIERDTESRIGFMVGKGWTRYNAKKNSIAYFKAIRVEKYGKHIDVLKSSGKWEAFKATLGRAKLVTEDGINFKYNVDTRGRIYALANYLSPQGDDFSKSLLIFKEGTNWTPDVIKWLMVHTANTAGMDKLSMGDRIKWTEDNMDKILDVAKSPVDSSFWKSLKDDDYWSFLTCAFAWSDYHRNPAGTKCHVPIAMDATQSGLQILSSIGRDRGIAQEVNVLQNAGVLGDAYNRVGRIVYKKLKEDGHEFAKLDFKYFRKLCKRAVMIIPYSAGETCVQDSVYEDRDGYKHPKLVGMGFKDACYLGTVIFNSFKEAFEMPTLIMGELQKAQSVAIKSNPEYDTMVTWDVPTGMKAFQNYSELGSDTVKPNFGDGRDNRTELTYVYNTKIPHFSDHKTSIAPNVVHSLDACLIVKAVCKLVDKGVTNFAMIHDSFGCDAQNVDTMRNSVKESFKEVCGDNRLNQLLSSITNGAIEETSLELGDFYVDHEELGDYIIC